MKSKDVAAFVVLYLSSLAVLGFVAYFWYEHFGWEKLWILGTVLFLLALLLGYLFAKYALSPLVSRNEELDRLLKETLHELNIPVATIRANVQMLKKSANERTLKRLRRIEEATKQLLGLYKEVDYLIKKEIDRVEKEKLRLDLFIQNRLEFMADLLADRRVEVMLEPVNVHINEQEFSKVFDNLISNALKYSLKGSCIKVILNKNRELIIEDEGEGIDSSELVRIFDRYYRASDKPGHGIGLAIVKQVCDENGIDIRIESQKGRGTKVILDLTKI